MAYRDTEVDPVPHLPRAASVPALPDWRRLYEQTLERAKAAEARAEELKWAEVAARTDLGSYKSLFQAARRKRLEAVDDAGRARREAKALRREVERLRKAMPEAEAQAAEIERLRKSLWQSDDNQAQLRHLLHEALRLHDKLKGRYRRLRIALKRSVTAKDGLKARLRRVTAPAAADAELRKALRRSRRQKTALNAVTKENARLRRTVKRLRRRIGKQETVIAKHRATRAVLSKALHGRRSEKRERPGTGRPRGQVQGAPGPRPHPAARARGARGGAQPARGGPHVRRLREALRGGRRGAVGAGRDRGQGAPARYPPGALAPDVRLPRLAGGGLGAAGAAAVPQHVLRNQRLVARAPRTLRVPAPGAARRRVARRPGTAGRRGDAGRQRAALRAAVRAACRGDPGAPDRGRAAPRRRDRLAGAGAARGGPLRPRLAVDLGRQLCPSAPTPGSVRTSPR